MAKVALDSAYRRLTVDQFLEMDFGDGKAELVDGVVFMMAGGNRVHNRVAANVLASLWNRLKDSGCLPYGSDQAVRTEAGTIRYPDVSVYCGDSSEPDGDDDIFLGDPRVVFEIFSTSTMDNDQRFKLDEYRSLPGVQCIVMIEPSDGRMRVVQRTGEEAWSDRWLKPDDGDLVIACLDVVLPRSEIFRR